MERLLFETKFVADDTGAIEALAWPFGTPDRVGDVIEKGAFADAKMPMPILFGHDMNDPLGAWTEATEAIDGLRLKGRLLVGEVRRADEVRSLVKAGAVRGISIGFVTRKAIARKGGGRTISQLELLEASLVTIPMHPGARVTSAKSAVRALEIAAAINRMAAAIRT
ncbi:HK97 family phage prohead protease [Mesorhizobium sp. M7A.F.Ca.MR.176.00.0.0]|uniref:HK97 family phage prohead protease n=1 Tax=Mesorhizobium sp. M7A.F.Ca.MR.176.00.0.0 TaxID=2496776 RepID=UPI000FD61825|nr:HK97 family phage prohead protease [Mesorhizobium sp. M7A.F.Ca.MR.176.00.0.0]RUU92804.1 HK97 family phage prohead protease [Mesorhizobium sp. M7A.F.Ca.MR.176.00.0.0]